MEYKNEKLKELNEFLSKSKVAIIGLGVSNIPLLDYMYNLNANVTVFDSKDFELQGISDEFRGMLAPIVMRSAFQRVSTHLEHNRRHPLAIRRYYRRLDY